MNWFKKMLLRTLALVFITLARLSFPSRLSLSWNIRNGYVGTVIKLFRKFEKVNLKNRNSKFGLNFLQKFWQL